MQGTILWNSKLNGRKIGVGGFSSLAEDRKRDFFPHFKKYYTSLHTFAFQALQDFIYYQTLPWSKDGCIFFFKVCSYDCTFTALQTRNTFFLPGTNLGGDVFTIFQFVRDEEKHCDGLIPGTPSTYLHSPITEQFCNSVRNSIAFYFRKRRKGGGIEVAKMGSLTTCEILAKNVWIFTTLNGLHWD